ncbi:MAG TPA: hypothetical protein VIO38_01665 [Rariglobus sp.]
MKKATGLHAGSAGQDDAPVKVNERVAAGGLLAVVHANDEARLAEAQAEIAKAIISGAAAVAPVPLVDPVIG